MSTRRGWIGTGMGLMAAGLGLAVLASCARQESVARTTVLDPHGKPVLHAVYADDLREAMRELNREASQQVWIQIYTNQEPVVDMAEVARTADKMADVATNRLPQTIANVQMEPNERQVFLQLAQQLRDQAVILKQEAQRNELVASQRTMNRIISTCNTCHTMFRGVAGPL